MLKKSIIFFLLVMLTSYISAQDRGSITGEVKDINGKTLPGATIRLEPDGHATETDGKGKFNFNQIYAGEYRVTVTMIGYGNYTQTIAIKNKETTNFQVKLTAKTENLNEVAVTGSNLPPDNLLQAERSAMPVTVITRKTIELMGSRRLDEVLKEQTGIAIVNNIGGGARSVGVQLQGFSSEYIMILIDGQPMVGRNSGNFDLSRISVSNIERIEIIKGASSCWYGSEALGGAINIITRYGALQPQASASLQYGSLNIADVTLEGETPFASQRGSANISANYYRTDGYNTNPKYIQLGTTAPPYDNYALQGRVRYRLTPRCTIGISGRYGLRKSFMSKDFGLGIVSGDSQDEQDLNMASTFDYRFSSGLRSMSRYYFTNFRSDQSVNWQQSNARITEDVFTQNLHRFEQQFAYNLNENLKFTSGLGGSLERMNDAALTNPGTVYTAFAFFQGDWQINPKIGLVGGLRYDYTNAYGNKINPSLGLQYRVIPTLIFKAGAGTGFKAPDFKSRYLVFYNPAANYLVIGNEVLRQTLNQLQQEGEISEIRQYLLNQLDRNLKAERSTSVNLSLEWKPKPNIKVEAGVFHHQLRNQINSIQVATGSGNRNIFTYQNLPKAVNKGIDVSLSISLFKDLEIGAGYQYLIAKDLSVIDSIKTGNWPYNQNIHNPATGQSFQPGTADYWGIENRSRHMLNIKAFYTYRPWDASINFRVNYRGKYPFGDRNGNQFIDRYDTFVNGFFTLNAAFEKRILKQHLSIRLTADNMLDYTDRLMPGQPGRVILAGLTYRLYKD
ncbi:TonB-dependent receptor [Pedobacter sp. CFBP9032]|uniref:TonB-dependent receptor n=1 Tax=Pedobacter sp. CFBP9032 TaxID=3096539 RepID=UPI002A6A9947|nr:TonB-dependent receptor [Pedobacter sp. CFBP9032]MDY0907035.1 TonB-dependent receptor [Pedobacter sp. CFBP9032]